MTTAATKAVPRTITVPLKDVSIEADHNPRSNVDKKAEAFLELVASVKTHGILQPILVGSKNGSYPVIAGERRVLAAREAKLKQIPVLEAPHLEGAELEAAVAENVIREDLTPVEEANAIQRLLDKGMKQVQAAKALGKSERWLRERLRLLKLPESIRSHFGREGIPLEAAVKFEKLAGQAPDIAEAVVEEVLDPDTQWDTHHVTESDKYGGVGQIVDDVLVDRPYQNRKARLTGYVTVALYQPISIEKSPIQSKVQKELIKELASVKLESWEKQQLLRWEEDDVAAARSYGCLIVVDSDGDGGYVKDDEWLADRCRQKIEAIKKKAKKDGTKTTASGELEELSGAEQEQADKVALQKKQDREKEAQERADAHAANEALGLNLFKAMSRPKVTPDMARLMVLLAIEGASAYNNNLAGRGLTYVREDLHQVIEAKNGTIKIEPGGDAHGMLLDELEKAKTVEAIFGVGMKVFIAARFADDVVTVQSKRPSFYWRRGALGAAQELIKKIAVEAKVLPERENKKLEQAK